MCLSGLADRKDSIDKGAKQVVQAVVDAANGTQRKAERLGHWEVAMPIRGVTH